MMMRMRSFHFNDKVQNNAKEEQTASNSPTGPNEAVWKNWIEDFVGSRKQAVLGRSFIQLMEEG